MKIEEIDLLKNQMFEPPIEADNSEYVQCQQHRYRIHEGGDIKCVDCGHILKNGSHSQRNY